MKHWTARQQIALDALNADKQRAEARLRDDIDGLPGLRERDESYSIAIENYIFENAQVLLDMLIVHFEPSPRDAEAPRGIPAPNEFAPLPAKRITPNDCAGHERAPNQTWCRHCGLHMPWTIPPDVVLPRTR